MSTIVAGPAFAENVGSEVPPINSAEFTLCAKSVSRSAESEDGFSGVEIVGEGFELVFGKIAEAKSQNEKVSGVDGFSTGDVFLGVGINESTFFVLGE